MKKTEQSSRSQRRLVLAHETLRRLGAFDLTRAGGGGGTDDAVNTTKQSSLNRVCTYEVSECVPGDCQQSSDCPT